jgi:predicted acetyltransferase
MENIILSLCKNEDTDLLARMNKQLIEDEKHDNKMNIEQLKERMNNFIISDYNAYFFKHRDSIVGYALVNVNKNPLYLRQFFICREFRRKGYGKLAFENLIKLLKTDTVDIEVMVWNEVGRCFWKSLGFEERSMYMRYEI